MLQSLTKGPNINSHVKQYEPRRYKNSSLVSYRTPLSRHCFTYKIKSPPTKRGLQSIQTLPVSSATAPAPPAISSSRCVRLPSPLSFIPFKNRRFCPKYSDMGVAVRSDEVLNSRLHPHQYLISPPSKPRRSSNTHNSSRSSRRIRSQPASPSPLANSDVSKPRREKIPVMGQVRILKRGEELADTTPTTSFEDGKSGPEESVVVKRGEDLDQRTPATSFETRRPTSEDSAVESVLYATSRLGPDPGLLPKLSERSPVVDVFHVGTAFITSPPPSSLPFPAVITKRSSGLKADEAASELRRMLRLH
ncbi:hypothetical protein Nepgr_000802 [Nepenthes gracilis]|uniref:Uncharacterized protein n=1 Tax=Nepenthes gracilis TaxID=150966 RepID=A0AAD3P417_NEPGR|nr:hypothetical protein Nepgr_000802 [Nepenthes gracilis]